MKNYFFDTLKDWFFKAFIFTVPIFSLFGGGDTRLYQERYFQGSAMAMASLFFGNIWITLFFLLNIILFVVHGGVVGSSQVFNVFLTGLLFACARNFFKDREFTPYLLPLIIIVFLSLIKTVLQSFSIDINSIPIAATGIPMAGKAYTQPSGLFFLPAFHAMFLAMMVPAFLFSGWFVAGIFLAVLVLFLQCSGAILGVTFAVLFYFYQKKFRLRVSRRFYVPIFPIVLICGIASGLFFTLQDKKTDPLTYGSRFESWHMMGSYAMRKPLGWGPDSFRNFHKHKNFTFHSDENYFPIVREKESETTHLLKYYSADESKREARFKGKIPKNLNFWQEAHNEFLQFFFEYGVFGILIGIFFFKELILRFRLSNRPPDVLILFGMIMVLLLSSTTQFPFHVARIAGIFGIILGAFWARTDKEYHAITGETS